MFDIPLSQNMLRVWTVYIHIYIYVFTPSPCFGTDMYLITVLAAVNLELFVSDEP